jgi:hypothetical protein
VNRKTLTPLREERFEFLDWKVPGQSFYIRKGDGRFWVVVIIKPPPRTEPPSLLASPWEVRYYWECDGLIIPCYDYKVERVSLAERALLQAMFPEPTVESRKGKPGKLTPSASLSAKRSRAGKRKAKIQDPDDILTIKKAFARLTASGSISPNAAAREIADLINEDKLDGLKSGPYYNISLDAIKRRVGAKK